MSKEKRNDPTAQDGLISAGLQQALADVEKVIKLQKKDPDNKTDPVDAQVSDGLQKVHDALEAVILSQAKDGAPDARAQLVIAESRAAIAEARALRAERATVKVKSEPRTYTEHGPYSYYRDLANYSLGFNERERPQATERILRHAAEIAVDFEERNDYVVSAIREIRRGENNPASETRAVSTATGSDGAFVTPQYLIDKWITYRSPDRSFTNQCTPLPLPSYGITFNIPSFTAAGAGAQQSTENTGTNTTTPSGLDVSVSLSTFSGYVDVSQQLLDRGGFQGQGGSFDVIVIQQSQSQLYAAVDTYVLKQALANAYERNQSTAATIPQWYIDMSNVRENLADENGVKLPASHCFTTSDFAGWVTEQVDSEMRPIVLPDAAALASRAEDPKYTGWMGLFLPGNLSWFTDDNLPSATPPNNETTILVGSPADMLLWVGDLIPYTAQQTNADTLTVLCGLRQYVAAVPRHNEAFGYITGSGYPTSLV